MRLERRATRKATSFEFGFDVHSELSPEEGGTTGLGPGDFFGTLRTVRSPRL